MVLLNGLNISMYKEKIHELSNAVITHDNQPEIIERKYIYFSPNFSFIL
jgi:hypothetical protein